ncbi:hypothetical protein N7466_006288 [Penicillium verhagenii]|uniref:uncharacterized protein n=1 Tax=Penicillium verhagenii TaxID=1562060 RepID=UPI002544ED45|nr:uncharacterized protein N7466_006288 [Penicillium verhagenii]KAJ5930795.1 hypothetical protein N7466_006288 [Penicillium verhagenii]
MPDTIATQVDIGGVSLASLGAFSTILTALSADDVQPIAMLQLQNLGAAFPITGPMTVKAPEYLQRFQSTRLERLGVIVGWRKGDAASLMAQSTGGQAIALLAVYLCNIYRNSAGNVLHSISKGLLPGTACSSSPVLLGRATQVLADKLAVFGFGTIIANQVCRIHEAYRQLQREAPMNILEEISEDWMAEILVSISYALREDENILRIRGCCGIGYILTLAVALFTDDCIVMIEGLVIHQGSRSSSIIVDIVAELQDQPLQVHNMHKANSLVEILYSSRASDADDKWQIPVDTLPISADFSWNGLIAALLHTNFQRWDLACSSEVIKAIGVCALSAAEITDIHVDDSLCFPASYLLGDQYRTVMHQRCEAVTGIPLPMTWPSYPDAFRRLDQSIRALLPTRPEDSFRSTSWGDDWERECKNVEGFTCQILDTIWLAFTTLFVNACDQATWRYVDFGGDKVSSRPEYPNFWGDPKLPHFEIDPHSAWEQICPQWGREIVAASDRKFTMVPSPLIKLGYENLCHSRGIELLDGPILFNNHYYEKLIADSPPKLWTRYHPSKPSKSTDLIVPNAEGVHSDLSLALSEKSEGLTLQATVILPGQRFGVCFTTCLDALLRLLRANPCQHPRNTPLKENYANSVLITSVRAPDLTNVVESTVSIVQTAGNPVAQFLSLSPQPAIFCYRCCLNCAYEQAISLKVRKIIIA